MIGLLGAWIQSKREHARWVRQHRLDAYVTFLNVTENATSRHNRPASDDDAEALDQFSDALNTLRMVGPDNVFNAAWDYWGSLMEYASAGWPKKTRRAAGLPPAPERSPDESLAILLKERQWFVDEAQRAVGISYRR